MTLKKTMPQRNEPLNRNDFTRWTVHFFLLAGIMLAGLVNESSVNSANIAIQKRSDRNDQQIYRMMVRCMTQQHDVAVAEFDWEGNVVWRSAAAAHMGVELHRPFPELTSSPEQDGLQILGMMHTCASDGRQDGVVSCTLANGGPVEMVFWCTPEGYVACFDPILPP